MSSTQKSPEVVAAADTPQTEPMLTPQEVVDGLRAMRARIAEVQPLTAAQRKMLRRRAEASGPVLQESIGVIGASDNVSQALGQPAEEVQVMVDESNRWTIVEAELRTMLEGVAGANLVRRQRLALIAAQAYAVGTQLAKNPANAVLVPHVAEIKRLKSFKRRKKAQPQTPVPPAPAATAETATAESATGASPASDAATTPKA